MREGKESVSVNPGWVPFTIDHLLKSHGLFSAKSATTIILWIALIAFSMFSVFYMMSGSWVAGYLDQSSINSYFLIYPPLIIGTLLVFWLGFEWGFVPVFLATFVIAYASQMPFYWAILFAIAFVLGLGIYAMSYYCISLDKSLRDLKSIAFFVVISFLAAISSSLGAFIWSFAHDMTVAQSTILWRGWWTGVLLQSIIIIGPILFVFTPSVERAKRKLFAQPPENEVTLNWIYGAILTVSVVLGLFILGSSSLGMQMVDKLVSELTVTASEQFMQATISFQTVTWISICLVLVMGLGGVYLVGSWNKKLEEVVDTKTSELEDSNRQLEEVLKEKEDILDDIHFRMRSNLTIMLALLEIQLKYAEKKNLDEVLENSYSRLQSLATVYETMHQTKSLNSLNIKIYTIKLLNRLNLSSKNTNRDVESFVQSDQIYIDLDRAIPLAIVLNEFIENAYHNAGSNGKNAVVRLIMKENRKESKLHIEISDNRKTESSKINNGDKADLSMKLSRLLIEQLKGTIETADQQAGIFIIRIPLKAKEMEQNRAESAVSDKKKSEPVKI